MKTDKLTPEVREYFAELGRRSKGGGRPRIPDDQLTPEQRNRREYHERAKIKKTNAIADHRPQDRRY